MTNWWEMDMEPIKARLWSLTKDRLFSATDMANRLDGGDAAAWELVAEAVPDLRALIAEVERLNKRHAAIRNADPIPPPCCENASDWYNAAGECAKTGAILMAENDELRAAGAILLRALHDGGMGYVAGDGIAEALAVFATPGTAATPREPSDES